MKINLKTSLLAAIMLSVALVACDGDEPTPTPTPTPKPDPTPEVQVKPLKGDITNAMVLDAQSYILSGTVRVKAGASLTIPAGTVIKAEKGFDQYILVEQGGKIYINGTAEKPVVMTANSDKADSGYWGGLIINGYAPITNGGTNKTEIDPSKPYGGDKTDDNSGVITYLILDYTGAKNDANTEHNGLTLNAVGNGTKIDNVLVRESADDAIEFFGGTVNVTNFISVNADDDMFDFTEGYSGTLQNAYGLWSENHSSTEKDPRGIEADGNHDGNSPEGTPQSNFSVKDVTFVFNAKPSTDATLMCDDVIKIRRGAIATIQNALIKGQGQVKNVLDFTDKKGAADPRTKVEYTSLLTTVPADAEVKGTLNDGNIQKKEGLTGADTSKLAWTKLKF
ncbi:hypothetical protein [uncultured Porphyromonas sp.]|uniref:hypothetical protein n=1 Tax=uncultured Porphyromonas sp. TaxID=159274 RepID=UPI00259B1233|nr:hypothetical protein [uncultured Porphyromonas sp.]